MADLKAWSHGVRKANCRDLSRIVVKLGKYSLAKFANLCGMNAQKTLHVFMKTTTSLFKRKRRVRTDLNNTGSRIL